MKTLRFVLIVLLFSAAAFAQIQETPPPEPQTLPEQTAVTKDLGLGAFANENGPILLVIDTALVTRMLDNPYVMFYAYMAAKDLNQNISVAAKDIVIVYKGQEFGLPSVKELRANYHGIMRDFNLYRQLGREGVKFSWVRFYDFLHAPNFYPVLDLRSDLATDEGHMYGIYGFRTPLYFKNPGLAKGDTLVFKVRDVKNPNLTGECAVILQ
ncbi:MAG: hypothetical protein NTW38_02915 [Candidatus Aminicenantes bacterium]|nr:hypothetical protein [Candidatus Aminicenantes bacterium]